jgi:hypothetical protein
MEKELPAGIRFVKGPLGKKYTAILPNGKHVHFGSSSYQQYKDSVPKRLGGGLWSQKNHLDEQRRKSYRARHGAQGYYKIKYTPAWFSYYFLW